MTTPVPRWPVAVLGATGAVGQAFVRLLQGHPWFELTEVAASERSAGKSYAAATRWLEGSLPPAVASLPVRACTPEQVRAPIVFSALDSSVAGEVEAAFARAGHMVLSNAKNYRMEPDVPLVIPEVNGDHLALLAQQRLNRGWTGGIVTNANCAVTVAALALAPLHQAFGVTKVFITTMQAVSGAGYPGVPSLDILGNVIPFIGDEEPKIETELVKLLGVFNGASIIDAPIRTSAHANRVAVEHGHTVCMSVAFERPPTPDEAQEVLREWRGFPLAQGLPSTPVPSLIVHAAPDRPQARRDVVNKSLGLRVGRIKKKHM